jgi:hypothetical protein
LIAFAIRQPPAATPPAAGAPRRPTGPVTRP